jgi:predicted aspartyl protease
VLELWEFDGVQLRFDYQLHRTGLLPLCNVVVLGRDVRVPVAAVIDSGATHPFFPKSVADQAGLELDKGNAINVTFGGSETTGRMVETHVQIGSRRFRLDVVYVDDIRLGYALLGRRTFFSKFNEVAFIERVKVPRVELRE